LPGVRNRCPPLVDLPGQVLNRVDLIEWAGGADDMANGSIAIGLEFASTSLTIFNALDENSMAYGPPADVTYAIALSGDPSVRLSSDNAVGGRSRLSEIGPG
jgi:hypothetical protein